MNLIIKENTAMENPNEKILSKLNHLITIAEDGKEGYQNAAKDVKDEDMQNSFDHYSKERASYSSILREQVIKLNGDAKDSGGLIGALHRTWMDMEAVFTSGDRDAIISECITGEDAALKAYKEALDESYITGTLRQIITDQCNGIEGALTSIKAHAEIPINK